MSRISDIELNILHMQLHHATWKDLEATGVSAKEAAIFLKMKRGELAHRFANALDKPATRGRAKKKAAEGPLMPIPLTVGEQLLLEF